MKSTEMKSTPVPLVQDGDKSQSAWDGDKKAANDYEWRRVA